MNKSSSVSMVKLKKRNAPATCVTILMICMILVNGIDSQDIEVLVNDSTFISCSPKEPMPIQWSHTGNGRRRVFVYAEGNFYLPYKYRLQLDNYNLIIPSVKSDDAGLYECFEEISGRHLNSVQMTVLESNPVCGSNMESHGYVGPSTCNLEQDDMTFTCAVSFDGDPPQMIWTTLNDSQPLNETTCITENGRINCSLILRADSKYDKSVFICRSTRSSAHCSTDVIKIQYFERELKPVEKNIGDEVNCSVKSNQILQFKWTQRKGNEYVTLAENQTMLIQNHGFFRCMVEYRIRHVVCYGFGTEVFVSNPSTNRSETELINSSENEQGRAAFVVAFLIAHVVCVAVITALVIDRLRSSHMINVHSETIRYELGDDLFCKSNNWIREEWDLPAQPHKMREEWDLLALPHKMREEWDFPAQPHKMNLQRSMRDKREPIKIHDKSIKIHDLARIKNRQKIYREPKNDRKKRKNANKRNSLGQTDLMIACNYGDVAAVHEILEWRDDDGERVDISAKDENGQTALSIAEQSSNTEIVAIIEQYLFLRAVENGDTETVKTYLSSKESNLEVLYRRAEINIVLDHYENNSEQVEIHSPAYDQIEESKRSKRENEAQFTSKDSITRSVWLRAVTIAQNKCHDEILELLFSDDRFINGFNEDGQTILHQFVAEYFETDISRKTTNTIRILLKSRILSENVLNLQNETILEILCKIKPTNRIQIDNLLQVLHENGIDLNGRNKKNETFLMLACENKCIDIVRSLLDLASSGYVLDIDAIDNSGETALMKAKEKVFSEIFVALLKFKFIPAVKHENADSVKSLLSEFRNTSDNFVKSWNSTEDRDQDHDDLTMAREQKSEVWLEAVCIAMQYDTTNSKEILKLLLDCDFLLSQEIETGYSFFKELTHGREVDDDIKLRLYELLLEAGKFNVNDRDEDGRTALHWAGNEKVTFYRDEDGRTELHLAEEEKLISLLIRYGSDVNGKDNEGRTPLMPISDWPSPGKETIKFPVLRTLLEEAGTLVNLDAMDCDGRTALMHAVIFHRPHDVELLLNKGASVNLSDHLGFTALHHALHRNINKYFEFPRNSEELKKIKDMDIFFDVEKHEHRARRNKEWSEEREKIVKMLLQRPDIDVNSKSIEMFSPLDIAEGTIPEIPSSIKDALKEKGAVLNVFLQTESQSKNDFHLDFTCKLTLKQPRKTVKALNINNLYFFKERWLALIEEVKEQIASCKDRQERTALHLFTISSYIYNQFETEIKSDLSNAIVDKMISLGCNVNEPDIFGRTPLHYANNMLWKVLTSKGADASIKDKDGNFAIDEMSSHFSDKTFDIVREVTGRNYGIYSQIYSLRLMNNKQMEINVKCVDDGVTESVNLENGLRKLWKEGEYAFRHPLVKQITKDVRDLMDAIAKDIGRLDPRFKIKPEFVGSSNEGTRLGQPDEFDFIFVLTKISKLCEVSQSPELPTGFVHLKRRPEKLGESSEFDSFFGKDGILNAEKLKWQFATVLRKALNNINSQLSFEWFLTLSIENISISDNIKKVLNIKMIKPLNFFTVKEISIDIVPCIHVDGWWPDDAISNVSDEIKKFGCNFVFESPQQLCRWVPYSKSCVRISFSKAESDMIKQSCDNAREAYMIGKAMAHSIDVSKYILKNCILYCIEALKPNSEKASQLGLSLEEMKSKFHQMDRYLCFKCLMKCFLEFVTQDFCPCYFLPNFSSCSLIEEGEKSYLKKVSFDWMADRTSEFPLSCIEACALYRCTSNDISECSYQLPAPDPLWERFDRKQLIASLCEIAYK